MLNLIQNTLKRMGMAPTDSSRLIQGLKKLITPLVTALLLDWQESTSVPNRFSWGEAALPHYGMSDEDMQRNSTLFKTWMNGSVTSTMQINSKK